MSVNEWDLPGIGRSYEIVAANGERVTLIVHHSGRRDLYVTPPGDEEPRCTVELSDDHARRLGAILGGAYFKPTAVEEIERVIGDFVVDWVTLTDRSPAVGRSIVDLAIRRETGMTVIAIIRGNRSINAPHPTEVLQQGDRLVVVGPRHNFDRFVDFVQI